MNDEVKNIRAAVVYKHVETFINDLKRDDKWKECLQTINDKKINEAVKAFTQKGQDLLKVLYPYLPE
jgi:tagatose-1,6-bisphosphate aldolase